MIFQDEDKDVTTDEGAEKEEATGGEDTGSDDATEGGDDAAEKAPAEKAGEEAAE